MPVKNPRINVVLEKPLFASLRRLASRDGVSLSLKVRDLVRKALRQQQDLPLRSWLAGELAARSGADRQGMAAAESRRFFARGSHRGKRCRLLPGGASPSRSCVFPRAGAEPEVDYVLTVGEHRIPLEVKCQQRVDPFTDTVGLRAFVEKRHNNAPFGVLVTLHDEVKIPDPRIVQVSLPSLLLLR